MFIDNRSGFWKSQSFVIGSLVHINHNLLYSDKMSLFIEKLEKF